MARACRYLAVGLSPLITGVALPGCAGPQPVIEPAWPEVRPASPTDSSESLALDASHIQPMYTELLSVDLDVAVRTAAAENVDILMAREAVHASTGDYEAAVGGAFPAIVPTALFNHVDGSVRATEGNIVGVGFDTFELSAALQWVINPGQVVYNILAAKKRLAATEKMEEAVRQETIRKTANRFYTLVLAQAGVSTAHQGVLEAEELVRINRLREQAGAGTTADKMRAEARLAEQRQNLVAALADFYRASLSLSATLRLDPTITLVPNVEELPSTQLVRDDLSIENLMETAITFRPDLAVVRRLVEAAAAEHKRSWWTGFGPQMALSYQYGGITGNANNVVGAEGVPSGLIVNPASSTGSFSANPLTNALIKEGAHRGSVRLGHRKDQTFSFSDQQRASAGVGWRLSLASIGELKTSRALARTAVLEAERLVEEVEMRVVAASQESIAARQLIDLARQQVMAAEEALRLSEAHLRSGTMTTLDVLQGQEAASQARLAHASAVVHYNQAQIELVAALGLVSVDTVLPTSSPQSRDRKGAVHPAASTTLD